MRCSRTAKAIGSFLDRSDGKVTYLNNSAVPRQSLPAVAGVAVLWREQQRRSASTQRGGYNIYQMASEKYEVGVALFLAGAGVVDFHRLLFLAALIFVPFKHHMVVIGDLQHLAHL